MNLQLTICTKFKLDIQKIMLRVAMLRFLMCHGAGYSTHRRATIDGTSSSGWGCGNGMLESQSCLSDLSDCASRLCVEWSEKRYNGCLFVVMMACVEM